MTSPIRNLEFSREPKSLPPALNSQLSSFGPAISSLIYITHTNARINYLPPRLAVPLEWSARETRTAVIISYAGIICPTRSALCAAPVSRLVQVCDCDPNARPAPPSLSPTLSYTLISTRGECGGDGFYSSNVVMYVPTAHRTPLGETGARVCADTRSEIGQPISSRSAETRAASFVRLGRGDVLLACSAFLLSWPCRRSVVRVARRPPARGRRLDGGGVGREEVGGRWT
ncbi:hypothetical protein B0H12DRAFT_171059 [Mycena haematopus]|nr:hypothetical protein B0H12DRAFT_171059 [Mycena haematopus]